MNESRPGAERVARALADGAAVVAAMALAYGLRFGLLRGDGPVAGLGAHLLWAALFSPVYVFLYGLLGVNEPRPAGSGVRGYGRAILCNSLGTMLYIDVIFLFRMVDVSRWLIVLFWLFLNLLSMGRLRIRRRRERRRHRAGLGLRSLVIVGDGRAARGLYRALCRERPEGVTVLGSVGRTPLDERLPLLGSCERLRELVEQAEPDELIFAPGEEDGQRVGELLLACENSGVRLSLLPLHFDALSGRPYVEPLAGVPLVNVRRVALDNAGLAFVKRGFDVAGALALLVLTAPVMLAAAVGTKLSSPGPVLFRQTRIGKDREPFSMLKFRSMRQNDAQDSAWTTAGDPRRTRFGAFMRRYSIDELPQLFNVLAGQMSLVGPRPEIPCYVEHFGASVPLYMVRHRVRPGMTGWAQVNGLRGDSSIPERVKYDLCYLENWSLGFDLKILLMTPFRGIVNPKETWTNDETP